MTPRAYLVSLFLLASCQGPSLDDRIERAFDRAPALEVEKQPRMQRAWVERQLCLSSHVELQLEPCGECLLFLNPPCGYDPLAYSSIPDLRGKVVEVRGSFVLIALDDVPAPFGEPEEPLAFDLYLGQFYKGRVKSLEAFDRYHLATITARVLGQEIEVGDQAATRL